MQVFREGNEVIIKTNYYEETHGFGENYVGEEVKSLNIDLYNLDFSFEDPNLEIKLVYEELELRSFKVDLRDSFTTAQDGLSEISEEPILSLNDEEKGILDGEFGNITIEQTARSYKDWIIVEFKINDYKVEYSYNKDLSKEDLDFLIEKDMIYWLKDISKQLTTEETPSFELDEFNKNSDFS